MNPSSVYSNNLFEGRTAFVTGSSQGIGEAIALLFAALGAHVVIHGKEHAPCIQVQRKIMENNGRCDTVVSDFSQTDQIVRAAAEVERKLDGRLDFLIHNAGVAEPRTLEQLTLAEWNEILSINLASNFLLTQKLLPCLERADGKSIVLISSIVTRLSLADSVAYAASKAGQLGLMRSLAGELGKRGIRVNAVLPGLVAGPRIADVYGADYAQRMVDQHQLLRAPVVAEDIAAAVVFLCSDAARAITSQCLDVNGGWTCP